MGNPEMTSGEHSLFKLVRQAEQSSRDVLESVAGGFVFPVPEQVRDLDLNNSVDLGAEIGGGREKISKREIVKILLSGIKKSWEEIAPLLSGIRDKSVAADQQKSGVDFFTEADIKSEEAIRKEIFNAFGQDRVRVFGEEANKYLGNERSRLGYRVDPIDGTRAMKFDRAKWSIMAGAYEGTPEKEKQVAGVVFFPEMQGRPMILHVDGVGVYVISTDTGEIRDIPPVPDHDSLKDINVTFWKHTDFEQRGRASEIEEAVSAAGGHAVSAESSSGDALEALTNQGRRAMVVDGDYNSVDFIPHAALEKVGFKIFTWDGQQRQADDTGLGNEKVVIVPPGDAGREVLEIVSKHTK